ncbi:hypothetical protein BDZ91DRAFT_497710 [Kalaharituber pfeilii]|nr:hypothetical protein BDZ91DRAFT_497710 [Kalaharituber pfeilii]
MKVTSTLTSLLAALSAAAIVSAGPVPRSYTLQGRTDHKQEKVNKEPVVYTHSGWLFEFTSTYTIFAQPENVVNANNTQVVGEPGAVGFFHYGINSHENVICYNITLLGVRGEYQSPANTATHIHEAEVGKSGPPRIAFPNPEGDDCRRNTIGCLKGPFLTGIKDPQGKDTGEGFHVRQIEENPKGFMTDTHTARFPAGAVRGQMQRDLNGLRFVW